MSRELPHDWSSISLGQCADWLSGGTPRRSIDAYWNGHIPWISARSLRDFYIRESDERVTEAGARSGTRLVPAKTILMIVRGMSLKSEFRMGITRRPVTFNQDLKGLRACGPVIAEFLAYAIKSQSQRVLDMVDDAGHGTGRLPTELLQTLPIPVPPRPEQRRIAGLLGALDDKIELDQMTSRTLEAMVHATFRSWFLEFAGHTDLVDSAIGPIPRGWRARPVSEILHINPRVELARGRVVPYVDMKCLSTTGAEVHGVIERPFTGGGSRFERHDVLLARITPCLENGKTGWVDFLGPGQVGSGSTEFMVLRGRASSRSHFVYCLARSHAFRQHAITNMTGSSGRQRVPVSCLDHLLVAVPPDAEIQRFDHLVAPLFERISINRQEIETLTDVRDALLPQLISGQLRIPESSRTELRRWGDVQEEVERA